MQRASPAPTPFLRETELPVLRTQEEGEDVLEDARLLVERLLDEEGVVENLEGAGAL